MDTHLLSGYCQRLAILLGSIDVVDLNGNSLNLDAGSLSVVELILAAKENGRKVMVIGNGGSAAIASHAQNDLSKAVGVRALAFLDSSLLTAMANDHGYESAYERSVYQWAEEGDLLIAISSSGCSVNILRAVDAARRSSCKIISLSGFGEGNPLRKMGDLNFYVPISDYGLVESVHGVLTHFFTDGATNSSVNIVRSSCVEFAQ